MAETQTLGAILEEIASRAAQVRERPTISEEEALKVGYQEPTALVGGTIDQNFSIPVKNGKGSEEESRHTFGVTISGGFTIQSPSDGTWTLVAAVAGKTVVNRSGVTKGEKIPFAAKTNFWSVTDVKVSATWSQPQDTTLTVHLNASY